MTPFTLTRAQVRDLDRRAADEYGIPGLVLMENAGRGCAELLMRLNPEKKPTLILCGPGNNGGDGFVMARHLDNAGWPAGVSDLSGVGGSEELRANRGVAIRSWLVGITDPPPGGNENDWATEVVCEGHDSGGTRPRFEDFEWIVDGLFGTGLNRPVTGRFAEYIEALNNSGKSVLAIDIPSGLDCDTGKPLGPTVRATHTATFVAPKRGFLNPKSREWTGEVNLIDIGAPRKLVDEYRS